MGVVAVTLELEHAVDEMLEHARPGDRAVFGHVADQKRGDVRLLGDAQESRSRLANLGDRPRRRAELGRIERLHRVDHANVRPLPLERRADGLELGLGENLDPLCAAEAGGAEFHLCCRLLPCDEQGPALLRDCNQRREQQRRLADPRLAADEHERGRDEPAPEHPVELGNARRDALGLTCLDVDEAQQRLG